MIYRLRFNNGQETMFIPTVMELIDPDFMLRWRMNRIEMPVLGHARVAGYCFFSSKGDIIKLIEQSPRIRAIDTAIPIDAPQYGDWGYVSVYYDELKNGFSIEKLEDLWIQHVEPRVKDMLFHSYKVSTDDYRREIEEK